MPERDLRVAYRVGFEDAMDAVQEILRTEGVRGGRCCRAVQGLIDRVRTGKARKILEDLMAES